MRQRCRHYLVSGPCTRFGIPIGTTLEIYVVSDLVVIPFSNIYCTVLDTIKPAILPLLMC